MKKETGGYKGWAPMRFFEGTNPDGTKKSSEGFKNVLNGQEVRPEKGFDGEPPYPTGDMSHCRHTSVAYCRGYDLIDWGKN